MPEEIKVSVTASPESFSAQGFVSCVKNEQTGNILALFENQDDAYQFRRLKVSDASQRLQDALNVLRGDYQTDVSNTAESIEAELLSQVESGEYGETLREWLTEHIHETIDGASRVIYTQEAILCLLFSNNDGKYLEDFGEDGATQDGSLNWSAMAFSAFEADVIEALSRTVDVNSPVPQCDECGEDDQEQRHKVDGVWLCDSCKEAKEEEAEKDEDDEDETEEDEDDQDGGVAGADTREKND